MREFAVLVIVGVALGASARADQYWVPYDAACGQFPEAVGWLRTTYGGGAMRSISDGILPLDSMADLIICDSYRIEGSIVPTVGTLPGPLVACATERPWFCMLNY